MTDKDILKPCPFCGGNEIHVRTKKAAGHPIETNGKRYWYVVCYECDVRTGLHFDGDSDLFGFKDGKEQAMGAWNTRVEPCYICHKLYGHEKLCSAGY